MAACGVDDRILRASDAFVASGASHAAGAVPDPGAVAGTTKFLREDATWAVPTGISPVGSALTSGQIWVGSAGNVAAAVPMSGDATLAASGALTLASVVGAAGPIGSATVVPIVTVDAKGRVTALSSTTITGVVPAAHATSHQNGGSDEVATATAGANAIPKAGAGGTLAAGWIPSLSYLPLAGGTLTGAIVFNANSGGLSLVDDAADVLSQRHSTTAQNFRVHNTFTDSTTLEYLNIGWTGNVAFVTTVRGATAGTIRALGIGAGIAVGSNQAGVATNVFGGQSTGTGVGGSIVFQTAAAGASSSTANALVDVWKITSTGALQGLSGANVVSTWVAPNFDLASGGIFRWSNSATDATTTKDTGIARASAGVVEVDNGTAGTLASLRVGDFYPYGLNAAHGETNVIQCITELVVIGTGSTTNASTSIPAGALVLQVTFRVTVAIPTSTSWGCGDATLATRFAATQSVNVNTTVLNGAGTTGFITPGMYGSATVLKFTMNGTPPANNAGRVRYTCWYVLASAPTS